MKIASTIIKTVFALALVGAMAYLVIAGLNVIPA